MYVVYQEEHETIEIPIKYVFGAGLIGMLFSQMSCV